MPESVEPIRMLLVDGLAVGRAGGLAAKVGEKPVDHRGLGDEREDSHRVRPEPTVEARLPDPRRSWHIWRSERVSAQATTPGGKRGPANAPLKADLPEARRNVSPVRSFAADLNFARHTTKLASALEMTMGLQRHSATSALVALLTMAAGCTDGSEPRDGSLCPQTSEFGNYGCARVAGTVRDGAGQPLAGVVVDLVPPSTAGGSYDSPTTTTGAAGTYSLEIHRFNTPAAVRAADTIPLYVRGAVPDHPELRDSVLVQVIFVPVDSAAQTVTRELVLAAQ